MLSTPDVIPYLRNHGLLDAEAIVDGQVRVFDASRRNRNFRVVQVHGPSLFIKQGTTRDGLNTTAREAKVYQLLGPGPSRDTGYGYSPRVVFYDPNETVLVLELLPGVMDLRDHQARRGKPSIRIAAAMGSALGALHTSVPVATALAEVGDGQAGVLSAQRPGLALLRDFSGASIELVRMLQAEADVDQLLNDLQQSWRSDALIHHDVRWDNVLVFPAGAAGHDILLIDWETAAVGDRAWDVGSALGEYLSQWLLSIPSSGREPPERALHLATLPLSDCQPAARALWQSYRLTVGATSPSDASELLERCTRFAGLKLLQSGLEQVQNTPHWTVTALCHLQVAINVMARPADAARVLLGLEAAA